MTKKEYIDKYSKVSETFEDEFRSKYNSPELMWESLKDTLITKKSLMIALNLAYKFGRDNGVGRSEANFNDFISTKLAQDILSKTY